MPWQHTGITRSRGGSAGNKMYVSGASGTEGGGSEHGPLPPPHSQPLGVNAGFGAPAGNKFIPKAKETAQPLEASRTAGNRRLRPMGRGSVALEEAHPGLSSPQGTPLS